MSMAQRSKITWKKEALAGYRVVKEGGEKGSVLAFFSLIPSRQNVILAAEKGGMPSGKIGLYPEWQEI